MRLSVLDKRSLLSNQPIKRCQQSRSEVFDVIFQANNTKFDRNVPLDVDVYTTLSAFQVAGHKGLIQSRFGSSLRQDRILTDDKIMLYFMWRGHTLGHAIDACL